jgi:hypothetical protein
LGEKEKESNEQLNAPLHPCTTSPQQVSDTSDKSDKQAGSIPPKHSKLSQAHCNPQKLTYAQGAIQERRSLLKNWLATVIGTAIAFALVSGIKDIRALVTTSMSAGSIAFVVSALARQQ